MEILFGDLLFYGNPVRQRSHWSQSMYKKILLMLYKRMGVWHNPGIIKQKQYIPNKWGVKVYFLSKIDKNEIFPSKDLYMLEKFYTFADD